MRDRYSLYEAKARLSAIVRQVREGGRVVITVRGEPAVELRPIENRPRGMDARIADLTQRGIITAPRNPDAPVKAGARRAGALKRFLASRD